jgi:uncharacterized RDD family membrane protein YckC
MGKRFGALLLDSVIVAVPTWIAGIFVTTSSTTITCTDTSCNTSFFSGWIYALYGFSIALQLAYFGILVGKFGQTVGHRVLGIKVVDMNTGQPIGIGKGIARQLVLAITGALCTLGYWTPFFDSVRRQGWHDKAVNSVVIPT